MAYDAATHQLVLVLIKVWPSDKGFIPQTWTWSGKNWQQVNTNTPPIGNEMLAFDDATGQLILFGGTTSSDKLLNETWDWTGSSWQQLKPAKSPPPDTGGDWPTTRTRAS